MKKNRTSYALQSRREFVKAAALGIAAGAAAPGIVTADKSGKRMIVGEGDYTFEVEHNFVDLPGEYSWQTTHNVAVDNERRIYVIHEGHADQPDHPAIFVFDDDGAFVRSFGKEFQGGGHGLEVRTEGNEQFLYVTAYQGLKFFSKLTLTGDNVWTKYAPMESGLYAEGEDTDRQKIWGRDRFMPTNFAFREDGGFFVADGYGAWCIHEYDADANWKASFGAPGEQPDQFSLPHGVWMDKRGAHEPQLVIADRHHHQLKWFTLDGQHVRTQDDFLLPANVDSYQELLLVPELQARLTLLGPDNEVLVRLGDDSEWRKQVLADEMTLRTQPDRWAEGHFIHPHDACFDHDGNILVAEWVATGRVSRLRRL